MPLGARWYYLTESIKHVIPSDYGNYEQPPQILSAVFIFISLAMHRVSSSQKRVRMRFIMVSKSSIRDIIT